MNRAFLLVVFKIMCEGSVAICAWRTQKTAIFSFSYISLSSEFKQKRNDLIIAGETRMVEWAGIMLVGLIWITEKKD